MKCNGPRHPGLGSVYRGRSLVAGFFAAVVGFGGPLSAVGEEEAGGGDAFGGSKPGEGAEVAQGGEGAPPQLGETHPVQSGDTLWDLCTRYLNSPWYWPKIWSYNPQITNPHWIYPGNELRFYPSDENLPTNVEIAQAIALPEGDDLEIPDEVDPDELVQAVGAIEVGRIAPDSIWSAHVGFVSKAQHAKAGQIVNSESEAVMLSDYDRVYMRLKTAPRKGQDMAVYRAIRSIVHPVDGHTLGYAVEIIGGTRVVETGRVVATGVVSQAFRPIERGDFVGPWPEGFGTRIAPVPNGSEIKGYIVETMGDVLAEVGEHHFVFIDRGRSHGVQRGNTFTVLARGDRLTRETRGLPNENVGQLMVVEVQDKAATAVVTFATRELRVGDKIAMRKDD